MNGGEVDRLTCFPIGLAHESDQKNVMHKVLSRIHGLSYRYGQPLFPKQIEDNRRGLALASYTVKKNRKQLTDHMCGNNLWKDENVTCIKVAHLEDLYKLSLGYKFMLSPHGNGLDCYRTWEALFLGMAVVVKSSTLDSMYDGLPVLIVNEWSELTPELLHRTWEKFQQQTFDFKIMYIRSWQLEMARFRNNPKVRFRYSTVGGNSERQSQRT